MEPPKIDKNVLRQYKRKLAKTQSAALPKVPSMFPAGWHSKQDKTETMIDGEPPKRGGQGGGRPSKEVMCPWCGRTMPVGQRYTHRCVKHETENIIAFYLRQAWHAMQTLPLNHFSYSDATNLLLMAACYNGLVAEIPPERKKKNAEKTD